MMPAPLHDARAWGDSGVALTGDAAEMQWCSHRQLCTHSRSQGGRSLGGEAAGFERGEIQYGLLFDYNPNPMWLYDIDTLRFLRVNEAAVQQYGYSAQQFLSMTILELQPADQAQGSSAHGSARRRSMRQGDACLHRRRDGTLLQVELLSERVMFSGRPAGLVLIHEQDRRPRGEPSTRILKRVRAMSSEVHALSVRLRDRDILFKASCRVAVKQGGFRLAVIAAVEPQTRRLRSLASASDSDSGLATIERLIAQPDKRLAELIDRAVRERSAGVCTTCQETAASQDESARVPAAMALLPLVVAEELVAVMLLCAADGRYFEDEALKLLTQLAANLAFTLDYLGKAKQLHDLQLYDGVTGLANRSLLLERVEQGLREGLGGRQGMALYLLDLERFKQVNDHLGRVAGDSLLKQVGTWLRRHCGNTGLVARVGVDQFALLLPRAASEVAAVDLVDTILAAFVKQPFRLQDSMLRMAAKAGIALCPEDGQDPETLYRNAEAALKQAKLKGDRRLRYSPQMSATAAERMSLETRLRQALERGEFLLHYQPKLSLHSGKLSGAEALIRWQDPRGELVSPARFIPVLEETGLIHEVGAWAIHQAMADARRWRSAGHPAVRIAVNVSPVQLRNPGFLPQVWRTIASAQQSPADLELEITESVIMDGVQQNIAVLQAIREMGVQVAIDDFGTGFSSLSYLSRLPVDALKIDRSFVVDMTAGPQGLALVSTIINLAHSLKLKVVAEGVENEEQSRLLRLLGCDQWQGYLCSPPLPAAAFESQFLSKSAFSGTMTARDGT